MLFVTGAAVVTFERLLPPLLIVLAAGLVLWVPLSVIAWFNDQSGLDRVIIGSWRSLSGVDRPSQVVGDCPPGLDPNGWVFAELGLGFANFIPGVVAIVGLPIGTILAGTGGLKYLISRDPDWLRRGVRVLASGVAGLVIAGLVMRLLNWMSTNLGCS